MFRGSMVALVTPMKNDKVDVESLEKLVEFHIEAGTHALVAAGTTGESGTLSMDEKMLVISTVVKAANERIPVIAGTGMNSTTACIELTNKAMDLGTHAALIMTPAYIKPTQEGLYKHYESIAHNVPMPIIMYNVPSRTACDLLPETVEKLSHISNIVGLKEATGEITRLQELLDLCNGRIDIYSGDDVTACEWMQNGAKGVISVTANVAPLIMAKLADTIEDGEDKVALDINDGLMPLHGLLFTESNPIPAKWALHRMGLIGRDIRLPLLPLSECYHDELEKQLQLLQLI